MLPILSKQNRLAPFFRDLFGHSELMDEFDGLAEQLLAGAYDWSHASDIWEDHNNIYVQTELPGVQAQDVNVSYTEGLLKIQGQKKEPTHQDKQKRMHFSSRRFGKFTRTYHLPDIIDPDSIAATFKDGVLTVKLSKKPQTKPRKIPVETE